MPSDADVLLARMAAEILSGLVVADPAMYEREAVESAVRLARAIVVELAGAPSVPVAPTRAVLQPKDFTYLGAVGLPLDVPNQTRFGYSTGALSGRVVDGAIHLFITGAQADTGWMDPVYEVRWQEGARCTLVTNWGDVTKGKRVSAAGNPKPLHGLFWDVSTQQLLWTYMDQYNVGGAHDPCLGASRLDATGVQVSGPWRMQTHSMRMGGYIVPMGAGRFASGAPIGSGNATSPWGAFLASFALPAPGTPADTGTNSHITIATSDLIYSDINHRQPRTPDADACGWTHYAECDSHGDQPQNNRVQDGSGCTVNGELCGATYGPLHVFSSLDAISAAAWIDGPRTHGLVMIGQLARTIAAHAAEYGAEGRCHVWYGPAQEYGVKKLCAHGQNDTRYAPESTGDGCTTMQSSLWIYDPQDLDRVAAGDLSPVLLRPSTDAADMSTLAHSGVPFPQLVAGGICAYGGAWYEPGSQLLFVSAVHSEWQGEWRPVIHAFKVAA